MATKKKYWRSVEELQDASLTQELATKEFAEEIPVEDFLGDQQAMEESDTSRRDFLKYLGFSTAAVALASCKGPIQKSIPYVVKPDTVQPGVPNFYASTYFDGFDFASVLVKTREGRPIKIEANKEAKYFGGTNARVQASVLSLYDNEKLKFPKKRVEDKAKKVSWETVDKEVKQALLATGGKKVVILTPSLPSPTTAKLVQEFTAKYPTTEHVVYDAVDYSAGLDAAEKSFGQRVLPLYDLSKAQCIVSFNADFLTSWSGTSESDYAKAKKVGKNMLKHIQIETNLSLTGANADVRMPKKPSEVYKTLAQVYAGLSGGAVKGDAAQIVKDLKKAGSKAVVLADGNSEAYELAFAINQLLNSEVVLKNKALLTKSSDSKKFKQFLADAKAGNVGVLISLETNPVYTYGDSAAIESALKNIKTKVQLTQKVNESSAHFNYLLPTPHAYESWNDFNPITGVYFLQQPAIQKIYDSRQLQDCLLHWMKDDSREAAVAAVANDSIPAATQLAGPPKPMFRQKAPAYYEYLKQNWEASILPQVNTTKFSQVLYNGFAESAETFSLTYAGLTASAAASKLNSAKSTDWELQIYTKSGMGDGAQANNPWLQELPDPITRTSWDNYLTLNPNDADKLGISIKDNANLKNGRMQFDGDYVKLTANNKEIEVPVFIQPGQALGTVGLALGYGRSQAGKVADNVGVNAYPLVKDGNYSVSGISLEKLSGPKHEFACIQMQNTLMGRYEIAREASLDDVLHGDVHHWNEQGVMPTWRGETPMDEVDIWRSFDRTDGPHFNLSIDLNSCTGCGACVIACQAENNVPVVGKDEIRRSRDMFWLRIDRYYSDVTDNTLTQKEALFDDLNEPQQYKKLIKPGAENPDVIFQPIMCQHCNHAPCETVCPVAATSHGKQGQNQMIYNRCVGTRYCANNCPYKVRRFNWFDYSANSRFADYNMQNDMGRMVLNPDVAVRSRGVMEKCSMCIQMTQATILKAKMEGRKLKDDEVQTACSNACSSGSIKFGDINDTESEVTERRKDDRAYVLLEEIGTKPNVFYHVKVRNRKDKKKGHKA